MTKQNVVADARAKKPPLRPPPEIHSFDEADLNPGLLENVKKLGWQKPTEIQSKSLPSVLSGKDVAGFARTGTGKTAVFLLAIGQKVLSLGEGRKKPTAVIVVPTRELAVQIHSDANKIFENLPISTLAVFGGIDYQKQASAIKNGVDIIIATPGRLKDYLEKRLFDLRNCSTFVCDEADRMFDMGFISDVRYFLDKLSETCQKLLFSATKNDDTEELAFTYLDQPEYFVLTETEQAPVNIKQEAFICESHQKVRVMLGLIKERTPDCSLIFTNMKITAQWLRYKLQHNGIETEVITGDLAQRKRMSLIKRIKAGEVKVLVATDVASRGLHIPGLTHVFNFDLPDDPASYIHRIGRTARAGAKGSAISLVCEDYGENLSAINTIFGEDKKIAPEWFKSDYEKINDEAGNPFDDAAFAKANLPDSSSKSQSHKRDRDQKSKPDSKRDRKGRSGDKRKTRGPDKKRGKPQKRRHEKKPRHPRPKPKTEDTSSIKGIVGKIFKTIFGKK